MTRRAQWLVAGAVALALLLLVTRKARGQGQTSRLGPPRYVGTYDRLPALQQELATRQRALDIARRLLDQIPPPAPNIVADMQAVVDANAPQVVALRAAIQEIVRAGQA